jgi:hypothetical protein
MAVTDTQSRVIISVDLLSQDAEERANDLGKEISVVAARVKQLREENKTNTVEYVRARTALTALSREQKAYINVADSAKGSNNQLRAQLSLLTSQYNALSKEERENTTAGKALALQTKAISDEIKANEKAVGDTRRSVGDYTDSIKAAFASNVPFGDSITGVTESFGTLRDVIGEVKSVIEAQKEATVLQTAATNAQTAAEERNINATNASIAATTARGEADALATEAAQLRAVADEQRLAIENQLIVAEERETAVLTQLAAEEAAIVAEERLRIAEEQLLVAVETELVAVEEARIAAEVEVAATTAATAAATTAAAAKTGLLRKAASGGVVTALIAGLAAVLGYLFQFNNTTDIVSNKLAALKSTFLEFGNIIAEVFSGKGLAAFDNFGARLAKARDEGEKFGNIFQDLEDVKDVTDNLNQRAQAEVDNLRLRARNRRLSNAEQQKLLAEADKIENESLQRSEKYYQDYLNASVSFAQRQHKLTEDDVKELRAGNIQRANQLDQDGKITADAYEKLKEAFANQIAARQLHNQRLEKIQNDQDKYAEKAEAEREKRQAAIDKINEDRRKSELTTSEAILTNSQREYAAINADIDKRIELYKKYNQDTEQLEQERISRITVLNVRFRQEGLRQIQQNANESEQLRIAAMQDGDLKQQAQADLSNRIALQQVDDQILAVSGRMALGEQGLNDLLQSFVDKRNAIVLSGDAQREQFARDNRERLRQIQEEGDAAAFEAMQEQLQLEQQQNEARLNMNEQLIGSYGSLAGAIAGFANENTTLGKAALAAQIGFAIAEIAINTQREISAINTRYALLKLQAAAIPVVGPVIVGALTIAQAAETGQAVARGVLAGAVVVAQGASRIIGKETGGIQYDSDGRGAQLPGYAKKDNMNARLREGETVIVSEAARNPHTRNLLSAINVKYGGSDFSVPGYQPGFATGGMYGGSYLQSSASDISARVQENNNFLAYIDRIKIYAAITDINDGQSKYATIVNNATF